MASRCAIAARSIVVQYARYYCTYRLGRPHLTGRLLPKKPGGLREARTVGITEAPDKSEFCDLA